VAALRSHSGANLNSLREAQRLMDLEVDGLEVNGKYDLRASLSLSAAPCHLNAVSYINRVAVAVWAPPVSAQNVDHLKTIGTKPLTIVDPLHVPAPSQLSK
jgi:hypothetical protein